MDNIQVARAIKEILVKNLPDENPLSIITEIEFEIKHTSVIIRLRCVDNNWYKCIIEKV